VSVLVLKGVAGRHLRIGWRPGIALRSLSRLCRLVPAACKLRRTSPGVAGWASTAMGPGRQSMRQLRPRPSGARAQLGVAYHAVTSARQSTPWAGRPIGRQNHHVVADRAMTRSFAACCMGARRARSQAASPSQRERYDGSSVGGSQVGGVGVLRSALLELGDDRLSEAA
jgi:hypothetical protein